MGRPPRRAASSTRRRLVALLAGLVCSAGLAFIPAGAAGATAGGPQVTLLPTAKLISIAADAGGDVVALEQFESGAYRIFEQTPGGVSTTLPFGSLSDPGGIAADSSGDVFVADSGNDRILELEAGASSPITLPFSGLYFPTQVGVDAAGDVFVLNNYSFGVWDDQVVELPAGSRQQRTIYLEYWSWSSTFAVDAAGDAFLTRYMQEYPNPINEVAEITAGSSVETLFPTEFGSIDALAAVSGQPYLYCSGYWSSGSLVDCPDVMAPSAGANEVSPVGLAGGWAMTADAEGDLFSSAGDGVLELARGASASTALALSLQAVVSPSGVASDGSGDLIVSDDVSNPVEIYEISASGTSALPFSGLYDPCGVAADAQGDVFVADGGDGRVYELPAGSSTQVVLPFSGLVAPTGVAVDSSGDVYVSRAAPEGGADVDPLADTASVTAQLQDHVDAAVNDLDSG